MGQFGVPEGDWFDELIPPSLRAKYRRLAKYGYGQYALRRSRPVVGATDRMVQFWQKVVDKQCVKIVVLGASVSVGVNIGGIEEAWHAEFIRWLNAKHPCAGGGNHTSVLSGVVGGCDSGSFLDHVDMFDAEDEIDLVFVEFGANDPLMTKRNSEVRVGWSKRGGWRCPAHLPSRCRQSQSVCVADVACKPSASKGERPVRLLDILE